MGKTLYGFNVNDGKSKWAVTDCPYPRYTKATCCTFVYSEMTEHWLGTFSYDFDSYLLLDEDATLLGFKEGQCYIVGRGDTISGNDIVSWVLSAASPQQVLDKEFLRIRINSDNKPDKVEFFTSMSEYEDETPRAILDPTNNPLDLKDYYGYEQYIPRRIDNKNRMQGRVLLYKITHETANTEFKLVDTQVQYKTLK